MNPTSTVEVKENCVGSQAPRNIFLYWFYLPCSFYATRGHLLSPFSLPHLQLVPLIQPVRLQDLHIPQTSSFLPSITVNRCWPPYWSPSLISFPQIFSVPHIPKNCPRGMSTCVIPVLTKHCYDALFTLTSPFQFLLPPHISCISLQDMQPWSSLLGLAKRNPPDTHTS